MGDDNNIRARLKSKGKTQSWLILELRKVGVKVNPPEFSSILSGITATPKALKVLDTCTKILDESEVTEN